MNKCVEQGCCCNYCSYVVQCAITILSLLGVLNTVFFYFKVKYHPALIIVLSVYFYCMIWQDGRLNHIDPGVYIVHFNHSPPPLRGMIFFPHNYDSLKVAK